MKITRQSGMSLIELMLAAALSLIISYFIMNIMITSSRTTSTAEGLSQAQETGRLVMDWLDGEISIAGYNSNYKSTASMAPMAALCTSTDVPPANNAHCTFDATNNTNGGDRLAIIRTTGGDSAAERDLRTCGGEKLDTTITDDMKQVIDVYWVSLNTGDTDPTNDYQFRCVTYDEAGIKQGSAQTIANGIESMQILVGVSDGSGTGNMVNFISANRVADWNSVTAVRIALLAREFSENNTLSQESRAYGLLDSVPADYDDTIARYVQNGTIWFPNTKKM
ncbi:PilW family protein [Bacterioplanoides pacificum]|uniref:PilW family protein n=1 Tax=Bacterioplanoides pacificum TaxID=1171596 RepID=A0ABV7VVH9_9GAMM